MMPHVGRGSGAAPALARLVPMSRETFATEFWDRQPLFSRAGELTGGFGDLFSAAAVDELVTRRGLRTPFVRMARSGVLLDASRYTAPGGLGAEIGDQVSADKVLDEFAAGATLVLQGLHRTWAPLAGFGRELVADLGHPAQVNAYVTPASERGFDAHYDVHDVFVIQILGEKRWRIHAPVHPRPLRDQPWTGHRAAVRRRAEETPAIEAVFRPNDVLYLPRGWIHSATALGGTSIHLTIGVAALTRHDLLREAVAGAAGAEDLRAALALGIDPTDTGLVRSLVADAVADLVRCSAADAVAGEPDLGELVSRRLAARVRESTRPEPIAPLASVEAAAGLHEATTVSLRHGLDASMGSRTVAPAGAPAGAPARADRVALVVPGKTVWLPGQAEAALALILTGRTVQAGGLPGLDAASSVVVARRLVREGILVVR